MYRMFYNCHSSGDRVDSADAIIAEKDTVIDVAPQILRKSDDFFGVIDSEGRTLQFMREVGDLVWMEIPTPKENGSYGCHIAISDLEMVLISLPATFQSVAFPKMDFSPW
jgi:hypothetical protein